MEVGIAISKLKQLQTLTDREEAHIDADAVLLSLVPKEVVDEYEKIKKWYA